MTSRRTTALIPTMRGRHGHAHDPSLEPAADPEFGHVRRRRPTIAMALLAIGTLTLATACGDDEDASGASDAYCEAEVTVEARAAQLGDPDADPKGYATAMLEVANAARAEAPSEVEKPYDAAISTLEQMADSGDTSLLRSLDLDPVHAFDKEQCGWNVVDVTAENYHFTGMPATLTAGVYSFEMKNTGSEFHVLVIAKKKEGVTASWEDLLADPASESKVDFVAGAGVEPGGDIYAVSRLEPGEYLVLCPIAQGTTGGPEEGTGPPHFMLGMQQVLTVTA